MIELGKIQNLYIDHKTDFGVYLCDHIREKDEEDSCVLLPGKQVPRGADVGDVVEVFVYKDSRDRLIATTRKPMLTLGQVEALEFRVGERSRCVGVPLRDLKTRQSVLIASILRGDDFTIPDGSASMLPGDRIVVVTTESGLNDLDAILED